VESKKEYLKQFISIINGELIRIFERIEEDGFYVEGGKMDDILDCDIYKKSLKWSSKSGLKKVVGEIKTVNEVNKPMLTNFSTTR
jgi:hypothetical protein